MTSEAVGGHLFFWLVSHDLSKVKNSPSDKSLTSEAVGGHSVFWLVFMIFVKNETASVTSEAI